MGSHTFGISGIRKFWIADSRFAVVLIFKSRLALNSVLEVTLKY